ncbi:MAG: response regulator transcription factor [Pontimonas sp.]|nr:response regulator transcription factor [Pontimonas sp.]
MNTLSVVVADDHSLTLQGVSDSLLSHGISVVGRGKTAAEAVALVKKLKPDALVTDLDFGPGPTGLDIAESLRASFPKLGIVVLSAYGDPRLHSESLVSAPAGVVYLIKQQVESTAQLAEAITVSIDKATKAEVGELPSINLTSGQIAVLRLVAKGLSNHAIAEELSVTEDSISKTINRMLKRLGIAQHPGVNSRAALLQSYFDMIGTN